MKALAIDSSQSRLCVAAMNGEDTVSCTYDIGMRQAEVLLGGIDYVMGKAGIDKSALDCAALCAGPGSFTGLRLSFAALKAIHLAFGTPIYAVPTLTAIAWPYRALPCIILPALDARKGRFYAAAYKGDVQLLPDGDYTIDAIFEALSAPAAPLIPDASINAVLAVGSGAPLLAARIKETTSSSSGETHSAGDVAPIFAFSNIPPIYTLSSSDTANALFTITAEYIKKGAAPMRDFDGPLYLRPCDAEAHLNPAL